MGQPEVIIFRLAYGILFVTFALMTWAYMARAESLKSFLSYHSQNSIGSGLDGHQACSFNQLCTCSTSGPDLGIVTCSQIPLGSIPSALNHSRVLTLSLIGNNLQILDDKRLVGSGLRRLQIKENNLHYITGDAFFGLEKLLWELDLRNNELTGIPSTAFRNLRRLELLDLSNNKITDVTAADFQGFEASISSLSLARNLIYRIEEGTFMRFSVLKTLDLSGNKIYEVRESSLPSSRSFNTLILGGNQLTRIPYEAISKVNLASLDLSDNVIEDTGDSGNSWKVAVTTLDLSKNRLTELQPYSLENFKTADKVIFAMNPIEEIMEDAFKNPKVKELDLSNCIITAINLNAFRGIENSLISLDLSFNNLSDVLPDTFSKLDSLQKFNIEGNQMDLDAEDFADFSSNLNDVNIIGNLLPKEAVGYLKKLPKLRAFSTSNAGGTTLDATLFNGSGPGLEELNLIRAKITSIGKNAFASVPGLKYLDLSYNKIGSIDRNAFVEVSRTLYRLKIQSGLRMSTVTAEVLDKLTSLREVDLSSNGLTAISDNSFKSNLELANFRFNKITSLSSRTFASEDVPNIRRILLGFNNILEIPTLAFNGLSKLEYLELNENKIYKVSARSFVHLIELKSLNLAGNKLTTIAEEAFQNLQKLQILDLSHNLLTTINFEAFDTIGRLSLLQVRFRHNKFTQLITDEEVARNKAAEKATKAAPGPGLGDMSAMPVTSTNAPPARILFSSSTIEMIDLSHNNISYISPEFFYPISNSLNDVDLSHNSLRNITRAHLSGMSFLQRLNLDHNDLSVLDSELLSGSRGIQVLTLDYNDIQNLPGNFLKDCSRLRFISLEENNIRNLDSTLFDDTPLEFVDLAGNNLKNFPEPALSKLTSSLVTLDISRNDIASMLDQLECLQSIRHLDLSRNNIVFLSDETFDKVSQIFTLDISSNPFARLTGRVFENFRDNLIALNLSNVGLETLPELNFSQLTSLDASFNKLVGIPIDFGENVPQLRMADFSGNQFLILPNFVSDVFPQLNEINLSSNQIRNLRNDSFYRLSRLHSLDVSDLPLESVQLGLLQPLHSLETLRIGPLPEKRMLTSILQHAPTVRHLIMEVDENGIDIDELPLPAKLSKLTITGSKLKNIGNGSFDGLRSRNLELTIQDTSISKIPSKFFEALGVVNNLELRITGDNEDLKSIGNPSIKYRPTALDPYLYDLDIDTDLKLNCDCDNGWMEQWLANWMQRTCGVGTSLRNLLKCEEMVEKMRNVKCRDKSGESLMQTFASIDCGWENGAHLTSTPSVPFLALVIATATITYFY